MTVHTEPLALAGAMLVRRTAHRDARGWFVELWRDSAYRAAGVPGPFVQDNWAHSVHGVLRGLHFQRTAPQGKLVSVLSGRVQDVLFDLRKDSPTYGRSLSVMLDAEGDRALWVPPGLAHGYCVVSASADVLYKATADYAPADEGGIRWNDPAVGVRWEVANPIVSARDEAWPDFDG